MKMARLHDHASKRKDVASPFVGGVDTVLFSAEVEYRGPVSEGVGGLRLRVDMLKVNAKIIRFRTVSTI